MNKTLLYFHRRKDTNEVFYVGIGSKRRTKDTTNRNQYWHNIVNKVGYDIEIIHTNLTWEEACELEIEYIKKLGRKDKGLGNLVNLTDGGDGAKGVDAKGEKNGFYGKKHTEESLKKISDWNMLYNTQRGKVYTAEQRQKMSDSKKGCEGYWTDKERGDDFRRNLSLSKSGLCIEDIIKMKKIKRDNPKISYRQIANLFNIGRDATTQYISGELWEYIEIDDEPIYLVKELSKSCKLSKEDVLEIRKKYSEGKISQQKLADLYGVSRVNIYDILQYHTWKDV